LEGVHNDIGSKDLRKTGGPFPSDDEDREMTYDQEKLVRRFRKDRRPGTAPGLSSGASRA
jgi:hypothetical protein